MSSPYPFVFSHMVCSSPPYFVTLILILILMVSPIFESINNLTPLIMSPFFDLDMSSMGMSGSRKPLMFLLLLRRKVVRRQIWTFLYLHLPISFTSSTDCWCWIIFYSAWLISKSFPVPRYHLPWYPAAEARPLRWHAHLVWWARPTLSWALCPASWVGLIHAVSIPSIVVVFFMKLIVLFFCFHDVVVCFVFVVLNFVTRCS